MAFHSTKCRACATNRLRFDSVASDGVSAGRFRTAFRLILMTLGLDGRRAVWDAPDSRFRTGRRTRSVGDHRTRLVELDRPGRQSPEPVDSSIHRLRLRLSRFQDPYPRARDFRDPSPRRRNFGTPLPVAGNFGTPLPFPGMKKAPVSGGFPFQVTRRRPKSI